MLGRVTAAFAAKTADRFCDALLDITQWLFFFFFFEWAAFQISNHKILPFFCSLPRDFIFRNRLFQESNVSKLFQPVRSMNESILTSRKCFSGQQENILQLLRVQTMYRLRPSFPTLPKQTHEMVDCWPSTKWLIVVSRIFSINNQPFCGSALEELETREGAGTLFQTLNNCKIILTCSVQPCYWP